MPATEIPIACSLDRAELDERGARMAELGEVLESVRAEGPTARLAFPADRRPELERFIAAESSCCPFFAFELTEADRLLELRVTAPTDAQWAVRGLVAGFVAGWGGLV